MTTEDAFARSLLSNGGCLTQKHKQSTLDVSMEPQKSAGFFWNRKKQGNTSEANKRRRSSGTGCAHEGFLEHEGFLSPEAPIQPAKPTPSHTNIFYQFSHGKTSEDSGRASSSTNQLQPRQSFSSASGVTARSGTSIFNVSKRSKRNVLSFGRSVDETSQDRMSHGRSRQSLLSEQDPTMRSPSFLRRCMSIKPQGRPSTPSTPLPAYNESAPRQHHLPAPVPEFGLVPGFGYEPPRPPTDLSSGAAARAAAAAQNEILATMRNLSLAEPRITRDSESGVGIEVRDCTEGLVGSEMLVVRQGNYSPFPSNLQF